MLKKTKKQRRSIAFNTIQMIPDVKDISYNNSSSIIAIDQHQDSMQQLSQKSKINQPNIINVKPRKTFNFDDDEEQNQKHKQKVSTLSYNIIPNNTDIKEQQESGENYKKNTVTTNTQSRSSQIKVQREMTELFKSKIQTQHYQYEEDSQEISQEDESQHQYQQQEQEQQNNSPGLFKMKKSFVAESLQDLIFSQIPAGCTVTCAVNFNHKIISSTRQYKIFLVQDKKYLYSAIKNRFSFTSQFVFLKDLNKKQQYLGYLKSNFTGLEYVALKVNSKQNNKTSQQCWIGYDFNLLGLTHQRNITVLRNKNAKLQKIPFFSQIKNYYENGIVDKFERFTNKQAVKNKKGQFQIDFHGKVTAPSVKNFIIIDQNEKQSLLFGKRTDNTFILQIGFPFSIFQGFAIAVSNLDRKICVR